MSVTVHFKDTSTNKITSLEYEMGAVIPELGDYIVSPFNADSIALVSQVRLPKRRVTLVRVRERLIAETVESNEDRENFSSPEI
jgi:hypothetical protein